MMNFFTSKRTRRVLKKDVFVLAALVFGLSSQNAYAYVDPGSGSVIVTTILGLIAAVGYTFRKFFYNLKRKLSGSKESVNEEEQK